MGPPTNFCDWYWNLALQKTTKLSLKFLLDSNTGSASSYKLIPYVKAQSIGVIPIKKLRVDISKSTPLDSFKIFDAPAGDSQLIAVMAVPRLKTAGNLLFAEFNVQENRNPENTNKDRQIDGGIDYFINFVD